MKFGLLMGSGDKTCQGYTGSLNHEHSDADQVSRWGVEFLRYDSCYAGTHSAVSRYTAMGEGLNATRGGGYGFIHFDIDNWGNEQVTTWGPDIADSWTTSIPIGASNKPSNSWAQMRHSFFKNIQSAVAQGPGHYNSPGELLLGRGLLTIEEEKTQFALWAVSKAPLIFTQNMTGMPPASEAILRNQGLIDVNQNTEGK